MLTRRSCVRCDEPFVVTSKHPTQRFCSHACYSAAKVVTAPRACDHCRATYLPRPERMTRGFCSQKCSSAHKASHRVSYPLVCLQCKQPFAISHKAPRRKFCSHDCYARSREVPQKSPNCRIEFTPRQKRLIRQRDGHCCVLCGSADRLRVDHILACVFGGDRSLENGRTLCHDCHSEKTSDEQRLNWAIRRPRRLNRA